jgi:ABC-type uncharacterized transport system permease subunit
MILASANPTSLFLSIASALAYVWPALLGKRMKPASAGAWAGAAWLLHASVLGWNMVGDPAYFGFAPALSVTFWLAAAGYALENQIYPQLPTRWKLGVVGAATVVLAAIFPGSALPATASVWMPVHLALGVASYGLFGTAVVHAWLMQRAESRIRLAEDPGSGLPLLTLERLTYRFVTVGFVLLTATLAVGLLFGEVVYGHALRWDHKTVFSILSWLTFAALLIGRLGFGWRGKRAVRVLYIGSAFLLLAYVGSRFVMEIVLGRTA